MREKGETVKNRPQNLNTSIEGREYHAVLMTSFTVTPFETPRITSPDCRHLFHIFTPSSPKISLYSKTSPSNSLICIFHNGPYKLVKFIFYIAKHKKFPSPFMDIVLFPSKETDLYITVFPYIIF